MMIDLCTVIPCKEQTHMFRTFLTIMAVMVLLPAATRAQTVDEIIAKNILAHGGIEKLKSVQTIRTSARFSQGSFRAAVLEESKRPEKVREELIVQGMAQLRAYDGKTGWQVNPFEGRRDAELLSPDDMKDLVVDADIDGSLVDYKQKGHKAELVGHDSVEGTDCYKIKLTMKNGDIRVYYLDADSLLEIKLETQTMIRGAIQENETYYGDYEEVGGIYYPFEIESGRKGSPDRSHLSVEKVELNVPLDDALFTMPVAKPEAKSTGGK
ncbi:MAG: outer membrane lipoprotein-sorting protein [Terriglobia bacterium]